MEDPTSRYTTPDPAATTPPGPEPIPEQPAAASPPPPPAQPVSPPPPLPPEPTWRPPAADHGRTGSLIFGVIILIVGLWFFASQTLDLDLPDIEWSQLWPLLLIGLGAWIVIEAMRRNR
jgi:hypothetical protein